jgi:tetratricopeptide (TPR) repeat protein
VAARDPVQRARALHARGIAENNANRPAPGSRLLRRALTVLEPLPGGNVDLLRGRIWLSAALSEFELRGLQAALPALAEAERIARRRRDAELRVLVLAQRGYIYRRCGQMQQALQELNRAIASRSTVTRLDQCNMLLSRAAIHLDRGSLSQARTDLDLATELAHRDGFRLEEYKARHNSGYLEFLAGNLPLALSLMDSAAQMGADLPRGIPLLDRARVMVEAGLIREADDALAAAATIFERDRLAQDLAEVELSRALCALILGDASSARRLGTRALSRFQRRGNGRWRRAAELLVLQADLSRGRGGIAKARRATALSGELTADGHPVLGRTAALVAAELLARHGTLHAAQVALGYAGRARRSDPIFVRLHAYLVRASLAERMGDTVRAARFARAGLGDLSTHRARFGSIDLQTASAIHGRQLAELDLSIALASQHAPAVFSAGERIRAVSSRLPAVRPPPDDQAAAALAELRRIVEQLRAVELDRAASQPLLHRRGELEREIIARSWTVGGVGPPRRPVPLGALRAALADERMALAYFVRVRRALYAVTVTDRRTRLHALGDARTVDELIRRARADLDVLAHAQLAGPLRASAASSLARALKSIETELLAPLRLDDERLLVVPTGMLAVLPWGLLPSRRGQPTVVAPSATSWYAAISMPGRLGTRVAAIAGPRLSRAGHEIEQVGRIWGAAVLRSGPNATRAALTEALSATELVHIAAHGWHQTDNPLFSSVGLADGALFAHELDQTKRMAEHVVLSACDLGLATLRPGGEALGLTSVLLRLGTKCVVSGVARVADDVAADVMVRYHSRLAGGADSAVALAAALAETSEHAPAPFVCFGTAWATNRGPARG